MSTIGQRIKAERERQGLSQKELARRAGVSQPGLSAIESSTKSPNVDTVTLLARALRMKVSTLLGEDEKAPSEAEGAQAIRDVLEDAGVIMPGQELNRAQVDALTEFAKANADFIRARTKQLEED